MIAALPMYDRPETAAAHDRLWSLFREAFGAAPSALTRDADLWEVWQNDALVLAQTCGFPYRSRLKDKVLLIGAPDHGLAHLPAGHYCSVIVTHERHADAGLSALNGARMAYNEALSQSGWAAPWHHFRTHGLTIGPRIQSGAHRDSARMVAEGEADFAALDIVSWTLMQRHDGFAAQLVEVDRTTPTPALPYISARSGDRDALFEALSAAIAALPYSDKDTLCLQGLVAQSQSAYEAVPNPPNP